VMLMPLYLCTSSVKAELIDGYVVLANKDTIYRKIDVPNVYHQTLNLFYKVTVQDSAGNETTYQPGKHGIKGFGFVYNGKNYDYHLWKNGTDDIFALKLISGKKVSLSYYYVYYNPIYGGNSSKYDVYLLESSDKKAVSLSGNLFGSLKKQLKNFFGGDAGVLKLLDARVSGMKDIPAFVDEVNSL